MATTIQASEMQNDPTANTVVQDAFKAVLERSATDWEFRQKLIADSRGALAEYAGVSVDSLPEGSLAFVESSAETTIVLPKFGAVSEELSDSQLETVAGGTEPVTVALFIGCCFLLGADAALLAYAIGKASR